MKTILILFISTLAAVHLLASTNEAPVKLAIISESPETAAAADVLTAEFPNDASLHLLERAEIEKVLREQNLSLNNLDHLKLGQLLGADGLLALQFIREGTNEFSSVQLVAVKPGVLLTSERFKWPPPDVAAWSAGVAKHLAPLLPKLDVLAQEAIPISVVNLHSAVETTAAHELEQQLTFLIIERLTREKRLFVLERKRMQALSEEKEKSGSEEQAFWNGSYLLDGTIDRNGFSPDFMTVSARMIPPRGGEPVLIEASGSRTNYFEVVNQLADKVIAVLKINSNPVAWNASDEAAQFFREAKWNLAWGFYPQARTAAAAAWALGKHDEEAMNLRVRTFMPPPDAGVIYIPPREKPAQKKIDDALQALELYQALSLNLPPDEPKLDSSWYGLGMDNLCIATRVLQQFNWSPEFYQPFADKLADLRGASRSTAALLSRSPSVHDSYFVGSRTVKYDELYHFMEKESIYGLKLDGGCLWQEIPEDTLVLYRELMSSPVFSYLHRRFWIRDDFHQSKLPKLPPRLMAWNEADQKRIPAVWSGFIGELKNSTNVLLQMEAKALRLADTKGGDAQELTDAFTNFFDAFVENRLAFKTNNVEVLYLDWGVDDLVSRMGGNTYTSDFARIKESLENRYRTEYRAKLAAKDEELHAVASGMENLKAFEKQKAFLKDNQPFDPHSFVELFIFGFKDYSKTEAEEIQPLLAEYKKHLSGPRARIGAMQVGQAEANVERILHPGAIAASQPPNRTVATNGNPAPSGGNFTPGRPPWLESLGTPSLMRHDPAPNREPEPAAAAPAPAPEPLVSTNVFEVKNFHPMPMDGFPGDDMDGFKFTSHQLAEGRVVLDYQYQAHFYLFGENGKFKSSSVKTFVGAAWFEPETGNWLTATLTDPTSYETRNIFSGHSTVWRGELYTSNNGRLERFNRQKRVWETNDLAVQGNYRLCNLDGHLYITDYNTIQEVTDDGRGTKLLASIQRQPPTSLLDKQGALQKLVLFTDGQHSLRASVHDKIYTWTGSDWQEDFAMPSIFYPESFVDGLLTRSFGGSGNVSGVFRISGCSNRIETCFSPNPPPVNNRSRPQSGSVSKGFSSPLWAMPTNLFVIGLPAALRGSDLYLLADHSEKKRTADNYSVREDFLTRDGYHASLLRYSPDDLRPKKILLRFENAEGCAPLTAMNPEAWPMFTQLPSTWMLFAGGQLCLGVQDPKKVGYLDGADFEQMPGTGHPPGVWIIPLSELDAAFAALPAIAGKPSEKPNNKPE
jgi:TolB-like protein